jgi:hypothetical protein
VRRDRFGRQTTSTRGRVVRLPAIGREGTEGFLVWHDQPFPKTHDLGKLGKQAVELDQTLEPLVDDVVEFTKYVWLFRYPGDVEEPSALEAGAVPHRVQALVEAVI